NQVLVNTEIEFSIKNVALFKYFDKASISSKFRFIYTNNLASSLQSEASGGAQPIVSLGFLRSLTFASPPISEQHRIVAKVDELFALCDQLKERLQHASDTQLNLTDAIVEQALY